MVIQVSKGGLVWKLVGDPEGILYPTEQQTKAGFHMANTQNPHCFSSEGSDDSSAVIFWGTITYPPRKTGTYPHGLLRCCTFMLL
jgi:hypothetical protein